MVGAKETSFWEARESARAALVAIILVTTLLTQLLINNVQDMLAVIQPVILTVGTLSVACSLIINTSLVTKNKHHHQTAFSAFIALVSVASSLHYYYIAQLNIEHSAFASLHANGDRIVAKRMSQGGLPLHLATSLSMPLIATPAGMHIQWARCVSMINLLIFTLIVVAVYDKIKCNGCIGQERNDQVLSLIYDILVILPSFAGAYFSCLPGASISNDYVELLRAGRSADSMLNHILKNSIAGAACLLELDQKALVEQGCEVCCKNSMLGEALEQLYKSMRWCSLRQVMVDLSAGRYQSTLSTVDVGAFLAGLCKGGVLFACEDATASVCQDTHSIAFDEKIAILAMENGVSNALSHGDQAAIKLKAEFFQSSDGCGKICFSVENRLPPDRRLLTSQDLKNCRDHALCEIATRKLDFAGASQKVMGGKSNCEQNADSGTVQMTTSSRGNRSGLRHTGRACSGAGGSFDLFLREEHGKDPSVVFQIILPAQLIKKTALNMHSTKPLPSIFSPVSTINGEVDNIPEGLRICAIDDSKVTIIEHRFI